jgi:hypothetical protein
MKPSEAAKLLAVAAAFDNRTVGETDATAWSLALGDATLAEASAAVVEHYTTSTERVMPAHVVAAVRSNRRANLRGAGEMPFPPGLTWAEEQTWRRHYTQALLDGHPPSAAQLMTDRELGIAPRPTAPEIPAPPQVQRALDRFLTRRKITR